MPSPRKLSKGSQELLARASFEVTNMHHAIIGPEHIVLAMLSKTDNGAYRVLHALGITYDHASRIVREMHDPVIRGTYPVVHSSASATAVVNAAVAIAEQSGQKSARPSHLLEASLRSADSDAVQLFDTLHVDREATLRKVADMIQQEES